MKTLALLVLTLALSTTGCKKKPKDGDTTGSGSGSAMTTGSNDMGSGSGSSMATGSGSDTGSAMATGSGSGSGDNAMANKAGMCPSTVATAATKVESKDGKVTITITSEDKDAIASIQRRTETLLKEKADNAGGKTTSEHDGKGAHGGMTGLCPVFIPDGATATSAKDAKGAVVTLTAKDAAAADKIKTDVEGRITKTAEWMKANVKEGDKGTTGGVGGGDGKHGGNHSGDGDSKGKEKPAGGSGSGDAKK